jgi:hypothetical protein
MSNQYVLLPTPLGNGTGTPVDVSSFGALKTIVVTGNAKSTKNIEINNDASQGGSWQSVATFQSNNNTRTIMVAAHWMRVRVSGYNVNVGGTNQVNIGGSTEGSTFTALPVTPSTGAGAPVDVSSFDGAFVTVQVGDAFQGSTIIEVSEDGASEWGQLFAFGTPGAQSAILVAHFMRVRRVGVPGINPGLPVVSIGFTSASEGGGGGGGVDLEDEGVPVTGNPHTTVNFVGSGVTVTDVAGVGTVTIPGGGIALQDEGTPVTGNPHSTVNFVGSGVTVTDAAGVGTVTIPGGSSGIALQDEGTPVTGNPHSTVNFVGSGVTVTDVAGVGTVTIPGGGSGGIALQDEGTPVTGNPHSTVNFVGAGVSVTDVAGVGTVSVPGGGVVPGQLKLGGILTPAATGGTQLDNYNPTGFVNAAWVRLNVDFLTTFTGIAAQPDGTIVWFTNIGVNQLVFVNESTDSTAANRFTMPGGVIWFLPPGGTFQMIYDGTSARWRMLGFAGQSFPGVNAAGNGPAFWIGNPNNNNGLAQVGGHLALFQNADASKDFITNGPGFALRVLNNLEIAQIGNPTLGANVNDWTAFGDSNNVLRVDQTIPGFLVTGLTDGVSGMMRTIINISAFPLTLVSASPASLAVNRFALPTASVVIPPNGSYQVWYDLASTVWRPFNSSAGGT